MNLATGSWVKFGVPRTAVLHSMRPKARETTQHGSPPSWLEENYPAGWDLPDDGCFRGRPIPLSRAKGVLETNGNFFSVRTETNRNKICFGYVSVCSAKPKTTKFGLLRFVSVFQPTLKKPKKQNCFKTNWNNPKFSEKKHNMLSNNLFRLVFCLFGFNRNIETLCFGIEGKQPKQTVSRQMKKTKKTITTLNFQKNTKICYLSNCFGFSSACFCSIKISKLSVSL